MQHDSKFHLYEKLHRWICRLRIITYCKMSEVSSKDELIVVQRKEKKKLLAKTQKMKHGVPKGDKKKKKEVTAEIAQLLADLDLKHENEIKEFEGNENSIEKSESLENKPKGKEDVTLEKGTQILSLDVDDKGVGKSHIDKEVEDDDKVVPRLSKAQKRRNKKALLEKERNKAIAEQELENLNGLRHLESEEIKRKLSERNLAIYEVPSDGNCLYKAVEHQLAILNLKQTTVQSLRKDTSEYMLLHMNDFLPFLTCPETGNVLTEEQYVKYCEDIAETSAWGGHIEVQVLTHICGFPIEIIQAQGPSVVAGDENSSPKLILSYHRHAYGLGEHYNSVVPVAESVVQVAE